MSLAEGRRGKQFQEGGDMSARDERYILHAWNGFDCDGHGDLITHSHTFRNTEGGREKMAKMMFDYADRGYTVSLVKVK